jgi:hypothetical protein
MGWIKRLRARHEERRRLYESIKISHKAIRRLVVTDIFVGYSKHSEEVRALYREMLEQVGRFADIVGKITIIDTMFYGEEMRKQVPVIKKLDDEIRNMMFSPQEQEHGRKEHVAQK